MAFIPPPQQPDFEKLRAIINSSPGIRKDNPLWQVLIGLLDQLKKFQSITVTDVEGINIRINLIDELILNITNIIDTLIAPTYLTTADETVVLPNSVQLLAGTNVTFDDSIPNQRTIDVSSSGTTDHVVLSDGVVAGPTPINDGAGNFIYIPYIP